MTTELSRFPAPREPTMNTKDWHNIQKCVHEFRCISTHLQHLSNARQCRRSLTVLRRWHRAESIVLIARRLTGRSMMKTADHALAERVDH